jgi:hypothetical protein
LAGVTRVVVVVSADPSVECVVGWVVGTDEGAEDVGVAVWLVLRELQPVTARATTTAVAAMIRTGRMLTPLTTRALWPRTTA